MFRDVQAFSGYSVSDVEEAKTFYGEILGITLDDNGMGLTLSFVNGHSVFLYEKDDHQPAAFTVLNFPVDDINAAVDSLVDAGVMMKRYNDMPGTQDERGIMRGKTAGMGPDIAWFEDPAGNVLAVLEN